MERDWTGKRVILGHGDVKALVLCRCLRDVFKDAKEIYEKRFGIKYTGTLETTWIIWVYADQPDAGAPKCAGDLGYFDIEDGRLFIDDE